jgi:hypothetical protein
MRTTVTLDPDTESLIRRLMKARGVSFKQALNDAIRAGAGARRPAAFQTRVRHMGEPSVALDRALELAGELEGEELLRRSRLGK